MTASDLRIAANAAIFTILSLLLLGASALAQQSFDSDGVKISYTERGAGPPVVLIHGWAVDSGMWGKVTAALAPDFRVIAIDCRGHGRSDKPHEPAAYGPKMAGDIVRQLDHLRIPQAHLVWDEKLTGAYTRDFLTMMFSHPSVVVHHSPFTRSSHAWPVLGDLDRADRTRRCGRGFPSAAGWA